jgi:hypothetical protein
MLYFARHDAISMLIVFVFIAISPLPAFRRHALMPFASFRRAMLTLLLIFPISLIAAIVASRRRLPRRRDAARLPA